MNQPEFRYSLPPIVENRTNSLSSSKFIKDVLCYAGRVLSSLVSHVAGFLASHATQTKNGCVGDCIFAD